MGEIGEVFAIEYNIVRSKDNGEETPRSAEKIVRNIRRKSRKQYWIGLKTVSDLQTGLRAALAGLRKQI